MQKKHLKSNIVIAGGGLVGVSFALCMPNTHITILETHLPDLLTQSNTNSRPISLSYGSHLILKQLGVWETLEKFACPILSVHISEMGKFGVTRFLAQEQDVKALGFVVPVELLQNILYQNAAEQKNIKFMSIQSIENITLNKNSADIDIKTHEDKIKLSAELLVASDGTNSTCRDLLNINTTKKNSGDQALIYDLILSENHDFTAYERFTKLGVLAILPLFNQKTARLVWTISAIQAEKIESWDEKKLLLFFQEVFEGRLFISHATKSACFPLQTIIAERQITQSAVLLGNAAHTIYPVAAQGFNLGLRDAFMLSKILNCTENINDFSLLQQYEKKALEHQKIIYKITNQLAGLFELNVPCLGKLRGLGLLGLDLITPLKNQFAERAMGL